MKPLSFILTLVLILATTSCKKDEINKLKGYSWGTVKIDSDQSRYIAVDQNVDFNLKGDLLGSDFVEGDRVFSRFLIDYDNQKQESTSSVNAFYVTFTEIVKFETTDIIAFNKEVPRDIIPALFKPWITYDYLLGKDLITFQCSAYSADNTEPKLQLMYAEDYIEGTTPLKIILTYAKNTDEQKQAQALFQSFFIPSISKSEYQIEIQFDAKYYEGVSVNPSKKPIIILDYNRERNLMRQSDGARSY